MAKGSDGPGGLNLGTGESGRPKEFVLIAVLAVVIIGSLVVTIMYNRSSDEDEDRSAINVMAKCLDPQCAAEFEIPTTMKEEDPQDDRYASRIPRFTCPACKKKHSALIMTRCPNPDCRKFYLSQQAIQDHENDLELQAGREPRVTDMPPIVCPYCKTDYAKYMQEQRKKRLKGRK